MGTKLENELLAANALRKVFEKTGADRKQAIILAQASLRHMKKQAQGGRGEILSSGLTGAALGGLGGLAYNELFAKPPEGEEDASSSRWTNVLRGAALGGVGGAGLEALYPEKPKSVTDQALGAMGSQAPGFLAAMGMAGLASKIRGTSGLLRGALAPFLGMNAAPAAAGGAAAGGAAAGGGFFALPATLAGGLASAATIAAGIPAGFEAAHSGANTFAENSRRYGQVQDRLDKSWNSGGLWPYLQQYFTENPFTSLNAQIHGPSRNQ